MLFNIQFNTLPMFTQNFHHNYCIVVLTVKITNYFFYDIKKKVSINDTFTPILREVIKITLSASVDEEGGRKVNI